MSESASAREPVHQVREAKWVKYLQAVASGDASAFELLYDESAKLVYSLALRITGSVADAEEVTIDVYQQVWSAAGKFDPTRGTASTWLTTIARTRAIDRLRARKWDAVKDCLDKVAALVSGDRTPEDMAMATQEAARIRLALAQLPAEQRTLIELAYYGGFSQSELALRAGLPIGTVKTRMRIAMMKLREYLAR